MSPIASKQTHHGKSPARVRHPVSKTSVCRTLKIRGINCAFCVQKCLRTRRENNDALTVPTTAVRSPLKFSRDKRSRRSQRTHRPPRRAIAPQPQSSDSCSISNYLKTKLLHNVGFILRKSDLSFRCHFWCFDEILDDIEHILHFAVPFAFPPFEFI
jgi:hypothetical protein